MKATVYHFGTYQLNDQERVLRRDGRVVATPPKALATLLMLVRADGRAVSKEDLLAGVWPGISVTDGTLTQVVFVLRQQLGRGADGDSPIETISRLGYRFRDPITVVASTPQDQAKAALPLPAEPGLEPIANGMEETPNEEPAVTPSAHQYPRHGLRARSRMIWLGAACIALAVAGSTAAKFHGLPRSVPAHSRVAVLSFRDLAPNPATAWVSSALRKLLSADLANGNLRIIPPTAVQSMEREKGDTPGKAPDAEALKLLCGDTGCDELLMGSYLIEGTRIRLDTRLVDARTGALLKEVDLTADDMLALVQRTCDAIRGELRVTSGSSDAAHLAASVPATFEAQRFYEEGVQQLRAFDPVMASQLLERSIALDPRFPLSHMELAHAATLLGQPDRALKEAHTGESLAGDLSTIDKLRVQAVMEAVEHRYDEAAATYGRLFSMVPQDLEYVRSQASLLENAGHNQEAVNLLESIVNGSSKQRIAPAIHLVIGNGYMNLGNLPLARVSAERAQDGAKRTGDLVLYERALTAEARSLEAMGHLEEAQAEAEQALEFATQFGDESGRLEALLVKTHAETDMGKDDDARRLLLESLSRAETRRQTHDEISILTALGQNAAHGGNLRQALMYFQRNVTLSRSFGQPSLLRAALLNVEHIQSRLARH